MRPPCHGCVDIRSATAPRSISDVHPPTVLYRAAHPDALPQRAASGKNQMRLFTSGWRQHGTYGHDEVYGIYTTSLYHRIDSTEEYETGSARFQDTVKKLVLDAPRAARWP